MGDENEEEEAQRKRRGAIVTHGRKKRKRGTMGIKGTVGAQQSRNMEHVESARRGVQAHRQESSKGGEDKRRIERLTTEGASRK